MESDRTLKSTLRDVDCGQPIASPSRRSTPSELLNHRAKELRDQAFKLESLARNLESMTFHLPAETMDTLTDIVVRGAFR